VLHHKRESIEAHLTIVFAALAVTKLVEDGTGWTIKQFVRTARRYRTVRIRAGQRIVTAEARSRPTYATHSPRSLDWVRTNLSQVGYDESPHACGASAPTSSASTNRLHDRMRGRHRAVPGGCQLGRSPAPGRLDCRHHRGDGAQHREAGHWARWR
jgi:hypothetical protein